MGLQLGPGALTLIPLKDVPGQLGALPEALWELWKTEIYMISTFRAAQRGPAIQSLLCCMEDGTSEPYSIRARRIPPSRLIQPLLLQMGRLRLREGMRFAQGHTAKRQAEPLSSLHVEDRVMAR